MNPDLALERRVLSRVIIISAIFLVAVAAINALTLTTEAERSGLPYDPREPWLLEITSVLTLFALVPLVGLYERRFPFTPDSWRIAILWHILGTVLFSAGHILGMWLLRTLTFPLVIGHPYVFFDDLPTDLLYEYRKDLLPYAVVVLTLTLVRSLEEHRREGEAARAEARETGRLTLKSGGRTIFLDATTLDWAEAAGNYVEIRAAGRTHLARLSLTALEQQLADAGVDVARIHRSYLVNRLKVEQVEPAGDGDFRIRMTDGTELRGSRRFRAALA
ncbi:LytTR family DNA-binding domain-containing protein [Devosia sp. CN2-171]|uniref:LytTR family DNA-binding domain-containing protein n=1 Tax=Devosia sp. CN2-171 TaxID=3400909 RepID=UPI003BF86E7A